MTEYLNLEDQIIECEKRITNLLCSAESSLKKAAQLQSYVKKCRLRMAEIEEVSNERQASCEERKE